MREELAKALKQIDMFLATYMEHMQPQMISMIKEKVVHKEICEMEAGVKDLGEKWTNY